MALKPISIADLEMRRRWSDDPRPVPLPKVLLEEDRARKLDDPRWRTLNYRPERDGYGGAVTDGADISGQEASDRLSGGAGKDTLERKPGNARSSRRAVKPVERKVDEKWSLAAGKYQLNPYYDPPFDITLDQAIGIPPLIAAAAALSPAAATALAMLRSARASRSIGMDAKIAKYLKLGFNRLQAERLASPYTGRGHHFVPRKRAVTLIKGLPPLKGLPPRLSESRFNILKPKGMTFGEFYELHYKVDPGFSGARLPGPGPGWSGKRLGLGEYERLGRLWYGSPRPLKTAAAAAVGTVGSGGALGYVASKD